MGLCRSRPSPFGQQMAASIRRLPLGVFFSNITKHPVFGRDWALRPFQGRAPGAVHSRGRCPRLLYVALSGRVFAIRVVAI